MIVWSTAPARRRHVTVLDIWLVAGRRGQLDVVGVLNPNEAITSVTTLSTSVVCTLLLSLSAEWLDALGNTFYYPREKGQSDTTYRDCLLDLIGGGSSVAPALNKSLLEAHAVSLGMRYLIVDEKPGLLDIRYPQEATDLQRHDLADFIAREKPAGLLVKFEAWPYR